MLTQLHIQLIQQHNKNNKIITLGTSGFRDKAHLLKLVAFRIGIFMGIISKHQPHQVRGIVVSASHNPIEDNGFKLSGLDGGPLETNFQKILENFATDLNFQHAFQQLKNQVKFDQKTQSTLFVGGDTRQTTDGLKFLINQGAKVVNCKIIDFGLTTTPQLFYYVYLANIHNEKWDVNKLQDFKSLYWKIFTEHFKNCVQLLKLTQIKRIIDCANGVGGKILPYFLKLIQKEANILLINNKNPENLNKQCGSQYVQKQLKASKQLLQTPKQFQQCVAFDGDADRIVLFTKKNQNQIALIDGDRMLSIFSLFFKKLIQEIENILLEDKDLPQKQKWSFGVVQTLYANGSSTDFIKGLNIQQQFAATGVKNLHKKAIKYDIGLYFQANGHGTAIFAKQVFDYLQKLLQYVENRLKDQKESQKLRQLHRSAKVLYHVGKISNPAAGDSIADFLIFQIALKYLQYQKYQNIFAIYQQYQTINTKVVVKNKSLLKVTEIEDKVLYPKELQNQVQQIVKNCKAFRAVIRASGTQDIIRIFVEGKQKESVIKAQEQINKLIRQNNDLN